MRKPLLTLKPNHALILLSHRRQLANNPKGGMDTHKRGLGWPQARATSLAKSSTNPTDPEESLYQTGLGQKFMSKKFEYGLEANAYIRLGLSTREIFWQSLCNLDLEAGRVFAFVPPGATKHELLHFAWHLNDRQDLENETVDWEYREREKEFVANHFVAASRAVGIFRVSFKRHGP